MPPVDAIESDWMHFFLRFADIILALRGVDVTSEGIGDVTVSVSSQCQQ